MNSVQDSRKTSSEFPASGGETDQRTDSESNAGQASGNHPPVIEKARLQLESSNSGDAIRVIVTGSDQDNDPVTFDYEWFRNGEPAGSNSDTISGFKRGDKVVARVTPFDGKDHGAPRSLTVEIANSTPKITGYKKIKFDDDYFIGQIIAYDPDGDTLSYSLQSAPAGMTINPSTGMIQWKVPSGFKGKANLKVLVSDGHGGVVAQDLSIDIILQEK